MKRALLMAACLVMFCGCAKICQFGKGDNSSGVNCFGFFAQAEIGMSQKEVRGLIGSPQKKNIDVEYRGKRYDEVWVYDTMPPTVLYFKNGVLEHKEYQQ